MVSDNSKAIPILFVDDELALLDAYKERFSFMGYKVLTAARPSDAIELVKKFPIEVAILDIRMPEMDGYRLSQALRKIVPTLPVIFLTGNQDLDTAFKTLQVKSNGLVEKPVFPKELDSQIKRILDMKRLTAAT